MVVNKYDINEANASEIDDFCSEEDILNLGHVPFDPEVTRSMVVGEPIVLYKKNSPAAIAIKKVWKKLVAQLEL